MVETKEIENGKKRKSVKSKDESLKRSIKTVRLESD
jgi:hypothetical protein